MKKYDAMKKYVSASGFNILVIATITNGLVLSEASAVGLGFYGGASSMSADVKVDYSDTTTPTSTLSKDADHKSFGMVLDSAVAKNTLYNNRFQIAYERFTLEPGQGTTSYDLKGYTISNDFGFGLVRSENVRFWIGPELKFSVLWGDNKGSSGAVIRNMGFVGWGVGPVLGLNINMGDEAAFCLKGGYLFSRYRGYGDSANYAYADADYDVKEKTPFINIGIIFRLGND